MGRIRVVLALALLASCARSRVRLAPPDDVDDPAARAELLAPALDGYRASFLLTWNGARIGEARERLYGRDEAYHFEREERIQVRRGGAVATIRTSIEIELDASLSARHLVVERWSGSSRTVGEAVRLTDESWRVEYGSGPPRLIEGNAVPSTLVPLIVGGAGVSPGRAFDAPVLVEGAGLALARLAIDISDDRGTAYALLTTAAGELRAEATLDRRGFVASAGASRGVASRRVSDDELAAPFDPPEIVDSSAIAVDGASSFDPDAALHLIVDGVRARPPSIQIDHQRVDVTSGGSWTVAVDPVAIHAADRAVREVTERTRHVARMIADDLAVSALDPGEALAAGRGDCTAHAVVLKKLLEDRGYDARLVTGFVLDDGALRRHRWVLVRVRGDWLAVDPMFDEVPASPAHVALAVHGSTMDELAFIDDVAFAGWSSARARLAR